MIVAKRDRVRKCQHLKSDKNKAGSMQNSLLKSFLFKHFL